MHETVPNLAQELGVSEDSIIQFLIEECGYDALTSVNLVDPRSVEDIRQNAARIRERDPELSAFMKLSPMEQVELSQRSTERLKRRRPS